MKKTIEATSRIVRLADRLEKDIRERNLSPGTPYFSAQDAARYLGVAGESANYALQLLEKRRIIERRRRVGAVVASPSAMDMEKKTVAIRNIYFFISKSFLSNEAAGSPQILLGIQQHFPEANILYNFVRQGREIEQISQAVQKAFGKSGVDAFLLGSVSFEAQKLVATSSIPAVIYGTRYPGIQGIPQIERDYDRMAIMCREYARKTSRKRVLVLMPQMLYAGDDRIFTELTDRFRHRIDFRFTSYADGAASGRLRPLFDRADPPDMIISHNFHISNEIRPFLRERRCLGSDVSLVTLGVEYGSEGVPDPHFINDFAPEKIGCMIGELLSDRLSGNNITDRLVPVRFVEP